MKDCIRRMKERPGIVVFMAIATVCLCLVEQFNPVTKAYGSLSKLLEFSYVGLLSDFANWVVSKAQNPVLMIVSVLVAVVFVFAVSAIVGIFVSGFAHTLYLAVIDHAKKPGQFKVGINKNYLRTILYFVCLLIFTGLLTVFTAFAIVPSAMMIKQLLAGDTSVILPLIFLILLTVFILFFAIVFFSMYMSFILPSIIAFKKGGVTVAIRMVNGYCWYLIPRTLAYLLSLAVIDFGMIALDFGGSSVALIIVTLLINIVCKFFANFIYTYYVFNTFEAMKSEMFG